MRVVFALLAFWLAVSSVARAQETEEEKRQSLESADDLELQFSSVIAAGAGSRGIWPVIRNGMIEAGFENKIRVLYQGGRGAEASERALSRLTEDGTEDGTEHLPDALLLSAESYELRAEIELLAQRNLLPIAVIGADTGSRSQPEGVIVVGVDAFRTGQLAGKFARSKGYREVLCLRTRREDPARLRLCSGVASGLGQEVGMLTLDSDKPSEELQSYLAAYLADNTRVQLIILDEGSLLAEIAAASAAISQAQLAAFGLARSQRSLLETTPERVAFLVDVHPFAQGRLAIEAVGKVLAGEIPASPIALEAAIVVPEDMEHVLYWLGRTR